MEKKEKKARNVRIGFNNKELKKLLDEAHMTPKQLAEEINFHVKSVERWIRTDTDPRDDSVIALSNYFGKDIEWFYNDEIEVSEEIVEENENEDFDIKQFNDDVINQELFYGCFIPLISFFLGVGLLSSSDGKLTSLPKSKLYFGFLLIVEFTIIFMLIFGCIFSIYKVGRDICLSILILGFVIRLISFIILVVRKCKNKCLQHSY